MTNAHLNRRTVIATAAWSAPVVVAATAAPLAAASTGGGGSFVVGGPWIDERSSDGWIAEGIVFTLTDASGQPVSGEDVVFSIDSGSGPFFLVDDPDSSADTAVAGREQQRLTRTLTTDSNGRIEFNGTQTNGAEYGWIRKGQSSSDETSSTLVARDPNSGDIIATAVLRLGGTDRGIEPGRS